MKRIARIKVEKQGHQSAHLYQLIHYRDRFRSHLKIIGTYPPGPPSCEEGGNQGVLFSRYVWF